MPTTGKYRGSGYQLDAFIPVSQDEDEAPPWYEECVMSGEIVITPKVIHQLSSDERGHPKVETSALYSQAVIVRDDMGNISILPYVFFDRHFHPAN